MRLTSSFLVLLLPAAAHAQAAKLNKYGNPPKLTPAPTSGAITARDLEIRLYQFADDSMQGRQVGRVGNMKGTTYIANEVKRLGLLPAGDNGTYLQVLPYHVFEFTNHSRLTVEGNPLAWEKDWAPVPGTRAPRPISNVQVVYGGVEGDTTNQITAAQAAGKFVVLLPAPATTAAAGRAGRGGGGGRGRGGFAPPAPSRFADAVAVGVVHLDALSPAQRTAINTPTVASLSGGRGGGGGGRGGRGGAAAPPDSFTLLKQQLQALMPPANIRLTRDAAAKLFIRRSIDGLSLGASGGLVTAALDFVELPTEWGRNVVAVIPGSDPALKNECVAVGAHNDHIGFRSPPVDHDSLKAFNDARNKLLLARNMIAVPPESLQMMVHVNMDSVRKLHPKVR